MGDIRHRFMSSPVGPLVLAGEGDTLTHLRMDAQAHPPAGIDQWRHDPSAFSEVVDQIEAYFAGERTEFHVDMRLDGTGFYTEVWRALQEIPYGETRSYKWLATRVNRPGAARAVGTANGRNPIAIVVPCHRVIGADGTLIGYGGGLDRKRALLDLEQQHFTPRLALGG